MSYGRLPLFPPACTPRSSLCMPLFENCVSCCSREECQSVRIQNPACPGEYADVVLCVDNQGNLSICVKRPPKSCMPPRRHECGYSAWCR